MDKITLRGKITPHHRMINECSIELTPPTQAELDNLKEGDEVLVKAKVIKKFGASVCIKPDYNESDGVYFVRNNIAAILPHPETCTLPKKLPSLCKMCEYEENCGIKNKYGKVYQCDNYYKSKVKPQEQFEEILELNYRTYNDQEVIQKVNILIRNQRKIINTLKKEKVV